MLRWIRDLLLYRTMGADAPLVNVDQQEAVARFCENLPEANLEAMAGLVEEAMELTERNVRVSLLLTALSQRLAQAMRGQAVEALYVPLPESERPATA
jgi:DNA polymerase-3 subunit delta'